MSAEVKKIEEKCEKENENKEKDTREEEVEDVKEKDIGELKEESRQSFSKTIREQWQLILKLIQLVSSIAFFLRAKIPSNLF